MPRTIEGKSLSTALNQSPSGNDRQSVTQLTAICPRAGKWHKSTQQSCTLIPIRWNQSRNSETVILKWFIKDGGNPENRGSRTSKLYFANNNNNQKKCINPDLPRSAAWSISLVFWTKFNLRSELQEGRCLCVTERLADWLTGWLTDWQADWLTDWLTG